MSTRVLVVDDSALMREVLTRILRADPEIDVVGTAGDGIAAWDATQRLRPDVLTLDVEMPRMDGLSFLQRLMRAHPMPVVMISSLTEDGCRVTLRALELGAIDFVAKPRVDIDRGTRALAAEIVEKVKGAAAARHRLARAAASEKRPRVERSSAVPPSLGRRARAARVLVAIGSSTGGTEALRDILVALPEDAPPVLVVQHLPERFTRQYAQRLDELCRVRVREAKDRDHVEQGLVLVAPGGPAHMRVVRDGGGYAVELVEAPPINHHRPAVDFLFDSCALEAGASVIGVLLTGMGADGAAGMLAMRQRGAHTIAQDEATCVVFGMPKEAIARGAAEMVLPLEKIAGRLLDLARRMHAPA